MHLPPPAVKQKMTAEGFDPNILDMDPDGPSPNQPTAATAATPAATAAPAAAAPAEEMDMFAQVTTVNNRCRCRCRWCCCCLTMIK